MPTWCAAEQCAWGMTSRSTVATTGRGPTSRRSSRLEGGGLPSGPTSGLLARQLRIGAGAAAGDDASTQVRRVALAWRYVDVLQRLAVLRIHRLASAEHRLHRQVVTLGELFGERILSGQIVTNGPFRHTFRSTGARRPESAGRRTAGLLVDPGQVIGAVQVNRIVEASADDQQVTVTNPL